MNVTFEIPEELQTHVMNQVKTGDHATTIEYVLGLVMCDRDRTLATGETYEEAICPRSLRDVN